jgi:hypothetical protein
MLKTTLCLVLLLGIFQATAAAVEFNSPVQRATLLELYTSEGCSSCPPADRWLSRLKDDARLWQEIVPVAFHVDYWNHLGWRDRFSSAAYSQRQSNYRQHGYVDVVYTPGFVKNGREWRGWFLNSTLAGNNKVVGTLKATIDARGVKAEFMPAGTIQSPLLLNVAWLGFDLGSDVSRGENSGKRLVHNFVVLDMQQYRQASGQAGHHWQLPKIANTIPAMAKGIAIWITKPGDPTPLQATGGFLDVTKL